MLLVAVCAQRHSDTRRADVLKADALKRSAELPFLVAREVVVQKSLEIFKRTVPYNYILGCVTYLEHKIAVRGIGGESCLSARLRGSAVSLFLFGERTAEAESGRAYERAVLDEHVSAAETECAAGCIEDTVFYPLYTFASSAID